METFLFSMTRGLGNTGKMSLHHWGFQTLHHSVSPLDFTGMKMGRQLWLLTVVYHQCQEELNWEVDDVAAQQLLAGLHHQAQSCASETLVHTVCGLSKADGFVLHWSVFNFNTAAQFLGYFFSRPRIGCVKTSCGCDSCVLSYFGPHAAIFQLSKLGDKYILNQSLRIRISQVYMFLYIISSLWSDFSVNHFKVICHMCVPVRAGMRNSIHNSL